MIDDVTLSTYSYSFVFLYFFLSVLVFVGLYHLKQKPTIKNPILFCDGYHSEFICKHHPGFSV